VRIVTYSSARGPRAGALRDGAVLDAGPSVRELLEAGALPEPTALQGTGIQEDEVSLLPPVPTLGRLETRIAR
jgi:hypothetical protein